jgi:hypothetical protein
MNTQVTPYSALPNSTVRAANGINYACRDTGGHEGNRALGIRGAIAGCQGLALARRGCLRGAGPRHYRWACPFRCEKVPLP